MYYLHLLLAAYYCRYDTNKALNHLFGCLEEIQLVIDEREAAEKRKGRPLGKYSSKLPSAETEMMLNEVKYNIVIVSLMREGGNTLGKA